MTKVLTASHKVPKKTAAEWERINPIILEKELIAVDTANTGTRFKIGDGIRHYNQLPFVDELLYSALSAKADKTYVEELVGSVDVSSQIEAHNQAIDAHKSLFDKKVDKVEGKGLSSNDFTDEYKEKIDSGDFIVVQSDWAQTDAEAKDFIKNKPLVASDEEIVIMIAEATKLNIFQDDGDILTDINGNVLYEIGG